MIKKERSGCLSRDCVICREEEKYVKKEEGEKKRGNICLQIKHIRIEWRGRRRRVTEQKKYLDKFVSEKKPLCAFSL